MCSRNACNLNLILPPSVERCAVFFGQVKSIQKHILYNQFLRLGGTLNEQSTEEQVTLARSLMARFTHAVTNGRSRIMNI